MQNYSLNRATVTIFISLLLVFSNGCRFIVPSKKDNSALNERGTFGSTPPAWAKPAKDQQLRLPANSGVIPQTFGVPEAVSMSANANASSSVNSEIGRGISTNQIKKINEQDQKLRKNTDNFNKDQDNSEIGKIEKECPGIESGIVDAIKTENTVSRIKKYLVLTKRCPSSSSIWLWLAKDYSSIGRVNDARRCAQASIAIDPSNTEAKAFLNTLPKLND